jgi:hypothetical protein
MENKEPASNFNPELTDNAKPAAPNPTMSGGGMKVVQPASSPDASEPTRPAFINTPVKKNLNSSVYPEATRGIHSGSQPPPASDEILPEETKDSRKTKIIILIVRILAVLMILAALNTIIRSISASIAFNFALPYGGSVLGLIIALCELALGIGIFRLIETARQIYVIIACILFIFSISGIVILVGELASSNAAILHSAHSTVYAPQNGANDGGGWTHVLKLAITDSKVMGLFTVSLLIQLFPIVFFTRRAVKAVFY